ncbi:MAG TPA: hypothetical protein VFX61_21900 [Micromonosporaceae bacterium]|nr:hypothetical protein [Micromonosporaceae bacterium]
MNVNRRSHWDTSVQRSAGQRAPRPGGRAAAQRTTRRGIGTPDPDQEARSRGAREFPTQGSAALRPRERIGDERALRVWDSSAEPDLDRGRQSSVRASEAPRLKVAPPPPVVRPRAPFVALILLVVVGGVLGILLVQTKVNENAFRLGELREQQAVLDVEQQRLEKEIAKHEAPGNLAAQARKLGLVESGPPAFIRLPDGRVIGVPQPAQGQPAITSQQSG